MSGDGQADIVQVTHGRVCYWPSLGHGRFGARVVMDGCPKIERADHFHPSRVRLADLDGTGTADLVYLDADGVHIWPNHSGNSFGDEEKNESVPVPDALRTLSIVDLHGTGMSTLVWSPSRQQAVPLRYTSPFGTKKPFLLETMTNGMGLEVSFEYAPSTKFYLADKTAGKPWATKLPFPVQVVTRVESYDHVAKTRFASSYFYHHGHYDTVEREFRGFGRVDQIDAETFDDDVGKADFEDRPIDNGELAQPPVLTRTWFHLGTWRRHDTRSGDPLETAYGSEYWSGDGGAHATLHCDVRSGPEPNPPPLLADEIADAHRALKGAMIRQEVYGHTRDEGQPAGQKWVLEAVPFVVTESTYRAVRRQPSSPALGADRPKHPAVFQSLPLETRTHTYDRVEADPRVHQWIAVAHDQVYGDVITALVAAYARRSTPLDAAETEADSGLTEQDRVYAVVTETEIAHETSDGYRLSIPTQTRTYELTGLGNASTAVARDTLIGNYAAAVSNPLVAYHETPPSGFRRRIVEHVKVKYYDSDDLPNQLAFGSVDAMALVYQTYQLDVTEAHLVALTIDDKITTALLAEGEYEEVEADTWWIPSGFSTLDEAHFYLPTTFTDPFENEIQVTYDAHDFFVTQTVDDLGNTVAAEHDYRVFAPKQITDPNGNRVQAGFDELGRVVAVAVMGKTTESLGDTLGAPTEAFEYVTNRWTTLQKPNYAKRTARETHGTSPTPKLQVSYVYTDGSGRVALTKSQAEPGLAYTIDGGEVSPVEAHADPRWVGSGKTVVNNKGNPVKQYEPYFAPTHEYEDDDDLREWGVTPLITYDAIGRVIEFQNPDETLRKAEYSPWLEKAYDENDNEEDGDHENTPARTHFDPLGRPFLVQADNGEDGSPDYFNTRTTLDIENQPLAVIDPLDRTCQTHVFSMSGRLLVETNIDKGARTMFQDVSGAPMRRWDARGQEFAFEYDELRRPTHLWLTASATTKLLERRYYGEAAATPASANLRGQLILLFDQAGQVKLGPFDFKGNLLESERTLTQSYTSVIDWDANGVELADEDDPDAAETAATGVLETEEWIEERAYDALNRIISLMTPDGSVYLPTFGEGGLLDKVEVQIRGDSATTFVRNVEYDAKGQRTKIEYGNATTTKVTTQYGYDPLTFRLTTLVTTRASDSKKLQDLSYSYDPVGNITAIADAAHQDVYFNNSFVSPGQTLSYDALYRLISASGREHMSIGGAIVDHGDVILEDLPHANQANAVRNYTETYEYDQVGNILELFHSAVGTPAATWTREYTYTGGTNRLASATGAGSFPHDAHGNITSMSHLSGGIDYSPFDQMSHASNGTQDTYFTYGADGQRVRKVYDTNTNLIKERIYLGAYEIYRERVSGDIDLQRDTLHIMDDAQRIAMVETLVVEDGDPVGTPEDLVRVQYTNHLGTAHVECDEDGAVISYEEMHPYGTSAYRSADSTVEVSARRYRYTGKERDEETGLDYFGARYYAPWLGRWTTADPLGLQAGLNLYLYGRASPVVFMDPNGMYDVIGAAQSAAAPYIAAGKAFVGEAQSSAALRPFLIEPVDAVVPDPPSEVYEPGSLGNITDLEPYWGPEEEALAEIYWARRDDPSVRAAAGRANIAMERIGPRDFSDVLIEEWAHERFDEPAVGDQAPKWSAEWGSDPRGNPDMEFAFAISPTALQQGLWAGSLRSASAVPGARYSGFGKIQAGGPAISEAEIAAAVEVGGASGPMFRLPAPYNSRFNVTETMMTNEFKFKAPTSVPGATGDVASRIRIHTADPTATPGGNSASGPTASIMQAKGSRLMLPDGRWISVETATPDEMNMAHWPLFPR